MLKNLVKNEWWTDTTVKTDDNGCVLVDAFKGDYRISYGESTTEAKLTDDEELTVSL